MNWSKFQFVDVSGLVGQTLHHAGRLNNRIAHLMAYRNAAEARQIRPRKGRPGTPIDEAVRREVILRHEIQRFEKKLKRDLAPNAELLRQAQDFLSSRGTQSTGGAH